MNSWEIIKEHFIQGHEKGTVVYVANYAKAALLYAAIEKNLVDKQESRTSLNLDEPIAPAIAVLNNVKKAEIYI